MTASSSIVASLGGGSGIDMAALASNLATAQFEFRANRLSTRRETLDRQISTAASLRSSLAQLSAALGDRVRSGDLAIAPHVADGSVATASSPVGSNGSGSYTLEVLARASAQTLTSTSFPSPNAAVGAGTLTFHYGTIGTAGFAEDAARPPVSVTIASGATLADAAAAINASGAGISAYVATTGLGAQLVLKGADGARNGFVIDAVETPGEQGLASLAWNPASGAPERLVAGAGDASFRLDGLLHTADSNDTGPVAPGLALKLTGTNAGSPTTVTFSNPLAGISSTMQDLVGALNEVSASLAAATAPEGGDLAADAGARALRRALSGLAGQTVMPNAASGTPSTLSDLGLALQRDGTFRLDSARLQATLARDPTGAARMFTAGLHGVYATLDKLARATSASADPGTLAGSIARYQRQSKQVSTDTAKIADQQEQLRASLVARFAKADSRIGASKSTLSFLQSQIDAWNAQRG